MVVLRYCSTTTGTSGTLVLPASTLVLLPVPVQY
jgi:hypothetical protein